MITCKICHRFVGHVITKYRPGTMEIVKVMGDCELHGRVEVDYDDSEELGIED